MEITSHISLVGGAGVSAPSDGAVYLVRDGNQGALIDAGTGRGTSRIMDNIRTQGLQPGEIAYLFLTHCHYDHSGGAPALRELTGCALVAHALDATFLEEGNNDVTAASWYGTFMEPYGVDIKVTGKGQSFDLGSLSLEVHHTPGHSPGSTVITVESDNKLVLFGQDIHGPLNDLFLSNRNDYVRSLEYILSLGADILCEGHFGIYHGKDEVRDFIESYL